MKLELMTIGLAVTGSPKFKRVGWWVAALIFGGLFAYSMNARVAPSVIGMQTNVPEVRAGGEVVFDIPARRDISRDDCTLIVSRDLVDSQQQRRTILPEQQVSASGLRDRERASPGRLRLKIVIPPTTPSGIAHVLTNARYVCEKNPTTWPIADWIGLGPIQTSFDWLVYVLPPADPASPPKEPTK